MSLSAQKNCQIQVGWENAILVDALTLASLPDDGEMDVEINIITRSKLKLPKLSVPFIIIKLVIKISTQVEN